MLSMYANLAKQNVSSTNLFHSFTLLLKFGITDVSSSTMNMFASTGPMVNPFPHHLLEVSLLNVKCTSFVQRIKIT